MASEERLTEEMWERIERYLRDEMSQDERAEFEAAVDGDEALRNEFEAHRMVHETLGNPAENAFRQTLSEVSEGYDSQFDRVPATRRSLSIRWQVISVAATVLLAVGVFAWLDSRQTGNAFDQNFEPYAMVLTQRAQTDTAATARMITTAVQAYQTGEYKDAAGWFGLLADSEPEAVTYAFYEGVSELAAGNSADAITIFRDVLDKPEHLLMEQSRWYLGLALWKNGDVEESRAVFGQIQSGQYKYTEAQEILQD